MGSEMCIRDSGEPYAPAHPRAAQLAGLVRTEAPHEGTPACSDARAGAAALVGAGPSQPTPAATAIGDTSGERRADGGRGVDAEGASVSFMRLDCGSLQSVVRFAQRARSKLPQVDALVLCAEVNYGLAEARAGSRRGRPLVGVDGYEYLLAANVLSPFLAASLLLRQLASAPQVRAAPRDPAGASARAARDA